MITFKELQKRYGTEGKLFVEVTDRQLALDDINSKTSCCWLAGRKLDDSGWIQLASPSIQNKGNIRTIFVCKESLIK